MTFRQAESCNKGTTEEQNACKSVQAKIKPNPKKRLIQKTGSVDSGKFQTKGSSLP